MIESVYLENFQKHENLNIAFTDGINCITGPSDSGKTSILRALYLVLENRPSIDSVLSHSASDADGSLIGSKACEVQVKTDKHTVIRRKTRTQNQYILDGAEFNAVGRSVPDEVTAALNMTEVNVQKQLDGPFLLSKTPGEIARYLNGIVNLDEIDICLSAVDSEKRANKAKIQDIFMSISGFELQISKMQWVENALYTAQKLARQEERKKQTISDLDRVGKHINNGTLLSEKIAKLQFVKNADEKQKQISAILADITALQKQQKQVEQLIALHKTQSETVAKYAGIDRAVPVLESLTACKKDCEKMISKNNALSEMITKIKQMTDTMATRTALIAELSAQMPTVCPLCGK